MLKKLFKIIQSRMFWLVFLICLQLLILSYAVFRVSHTTAIFLFFYILSIALVIFIVTREENASYRIAWMLIMVVMPFVGSVLYIIFGNKKGGRRTRKEVSKFVAEIKNISLYDEKTYKQLLAENNGITRQIQYIYTASGYGVWQNTKSTYFAKSDLFMEDLLKEIEKAKKFIFIEYFILDRGKEWGRVVEILKKKVKEGVRVCIMYDDLGAINVLPRRYYQTLRNYGFEAYAFNPVRFHLSPRLNYRDHRKIFDIDGDIVYTGGLNIADEYMNNIVRFGWWKDNAIKIEGDAVWSFTVMYLRLWSTVSGKKETDYDFYRPSVSYPSDGYVQPFSDSPFDGETIARNAYMQVINNAHSYVWIVTPYLVLDDEMMTTLEIAAKSGVDVRIVTPYYADKKTVHEVTRSHFEALVEAGVKIYEYMPGFIHSKTLVSDDKIAFVGSANMDFRSFYLHFELSTLFVDSTVIQDVKKDTLDAIASSELQTMEKLNQISFFTKVARWFFGFFAPAF